MGTFLKGATVVDLEPAVVERADLRIEGERIVARGPSLDPQAGDEVIDLEGRLLFPGLVSAHHRFASVLLRGAPRAGVGFGVEQQVQHRLARQLTGDQLEAAATAGALEGLQAGVTTVFAVHAAPAHVAGSLGRVANAVNAVGLRGVLGCEISERDGALAREAALDENASFAVRARGRVRGAFAVASLSTLSDEGLTAVAEGHRRAGTLLLATLAEDPREEAESRARFDAAPSERLLERGLAGSRVVLSHNVHLSWPELSRLIAEGTWLAHAPRSNMASQTGLATAVKFGVRGCLGTDAMSLDVLAEAQVAALRSLDSGQPIDALRFVVNGHRLATEAFGTTIGPLEPGALADLLVLDYQSPTPVTAQSLAAHVLQGLSARAVESVMVDGLWRLWKRKALAVDVAAVFRASSEAAAGLWPALAAD